MSLLFLSFFPGERFAPYYVLIAFFCLFWYYICLTLNLVDLIVSVKFCFCGFLGWEVRFGCEGMGCVTVISTSIASWVVGVRPICYRTAFFYCKHAQLSLGAIPLFVCLEGGGGGGGGKTCLTHVCPLGARSCVLCVPHGCMRLPGHPPTCVDLPATALLLFLRTDVAVLSSWGGGFVHAYVSGTIRSIVRSIARDPYVWGVGSSFVRRIRRHLLRST